MFASPALKAVICISQTAKRRHPPPFRGDGGEAARDLQRRGPGRVSVLRAWDRPATRAALSLADGHVAFLLLGSDYARKGVATAIRALARLPG